MESTEGCWRGCRRGGSGAGAAAGGATAGGATGPGATVVLSTTSS